MIQRLTGKATLTVHLSQHFVVHVQNGLLDRENDDSSTANATATKIRRGPSIRRGGREQKTAVGTVEANPSHGLVKARDVRQNRDRMAEEK